MSKSLTCNTHTDKLSAFEHLISLKHAVLSLIDWVRALFTFSLLHCCCVLGILLAALLVCRFLMIFSSLLLLFRLLLLSSLFCTGFFHFLQLLLELCPTSLYPLLCIGVWSWKERMTCSLIIKQPKLWLQLLLWHLMQFPEVNMGWTKNRLKCFYLAILTDLRFAFSSFWVFDHFGFSLVYFNF